MQKKCLSGVYPVMKVVSVAARVFAERVNEYVPYMQRTFSFVERSQNALDQSGDG